MLLSFTTVIAGIILRIYGDNFKYKYVTIIFLIDIERNCKLLNRWVLGYPQSIRKGRVTMTTESCTNTCAQQLTSQTYLILTQTLTLTLLLNSMHSTKYCHTFYVSREIHTRQRYCTIFSIFRCNCHSPVHVNIYTVAIWPLDMSPYKNICRRPQRG